MADMTPGWLGPRDPEQPNLNIGYADGSVTNCTTHDMGDCPYHLPPEGTRHVDEAPTYPFVKLTDVEKLAALQTYLALLKPIEAALRASVTADMGALHAERVGAYLPDGTKLAAVGRSPGRLTVRVTDETAALAWCVARYPDEVQTVQSIRPAFLKMLTDIAKTDTAHAGGMGLDPRTGEILPFIEVTRGAPFVTVTTTTEGVQRMTEYANNFVNMIESTPTDERIH